MTVLDDNQLSSLDGHSRTFFQNVHKRLGIGIQNQSQDIAAENPVANATGAIAGRMYADAYLHTPSGANSSSIGLDRDALAFADAARDRVNAIGAPAGSIAARNSPDQYGSVASRQFKDTFGSGKLDDMNNAIDNADPSARQGLRQRFQSTVVEGLQNGNG